ncbi:unnamed protein product [Mortierella alpina]
MPGSQSAADEPARLLSAGTRTRLLLLLLAILLSNMSIVFALPVNSNSTLIPINDDGTVDLDVGQRSRLSGQNWGLGVVFIVLGLTEVFYGFKLIRLTLLVTGFLSWAITAMIIMVAIRWDLVYTTFMPQYYYLWVWLAAGLTGATLSFRYWDLGVTFAGAFGGFAVAMGVIAAANLAIQNVARYVILGVFVLGLSAFATFFERIFIILATSSGGAYMFMYGVDELAQVGYREMIVIFDFTGKTLTYHPNWAVYVMLASSLVLSALGSAWEFWHHTTPMFLDRKAIFRIYGRPFGKRPKKLVGQRIHHHLRTRSELYAYVVSCGCFERRTIDDVLYHDDEHCPQEVVQQPPAPIPDPVSAQQPLTSEGKETDDTAAKAPQTTTPTDDSSVPLKTAPIDLEGEPRNPDGEEDDVVSALPPSKDTLAVEGHNGTQICEAGELAPRKAQPESALATPSTSALLDHDGPLEPSRLASASPAQAAPAELQATPHPHPDPLHSSVASRMDARAVDLIRMVVDDTPGNTIPRDFYRPAYRPSPWSIPEQPSSTSLSDFGSSTTAVNMHGLHMLEFSESSQGTQEPQDADEPGPESTAG